MSRELARACGALRRRLRRAVEDYRRWHAPTRCTTAGCDCPCGFCHHDRRHVPGGAS